MVTSSAVVGSSAISKTGSLATPIASITRCRIPPENWCGKDAAARSGAATPIRRSNSTARTRAFAGV